MKGKEAARILGTLGGKASAKSLTKQQRIERARKAGKSKKKKGDEKNSD